MRPCAGPCAAAGLMLSATLVCGQAPVAGTSPTPGDTSATLTTPSELSVAEYAERLTALTRALRANSYAQARAVAEALRAARVTWQQETLAPDAGLLDEACRADAPPIARRVAGRIARLAEALRTASPDAAVRAEPEALARALRRDDLTPGGTVDAHLSAPPLGPVERLQKVLDRILDWLAGAWTRLKEWLRRFWPRTPEPAVDAAQLSRTTMVVLVVVGLATVLIALLAVRAMLQPNDVPGKSEATQAAAHRDDDPLSREANEWALYAEQLAVAGRRREAIRAWYHAVLVTLFRMSLLHYAKGRTNWEYVADLSPDLRWRAIFIDLTRGFDLEWYGHDVSSAQALAAYARHGRSVLRALEAGEAGA